MSASYNRIVLVGNLVAAVELRYTPTGTAVTDISLAVNERTKKGENWVESVSFFNVTLWGRTAEIANQYLGKGSSVLIEGRLKQDRWEQDGKNRQAIKIIGEKMQMMGSKPATRTTATAATETGKPSEARKPDAQRETAMTAEEVLEQQRRQLALQKQRAKDLITNQINTTEVEVPN